MRFWNSFLMGIVGAQIQATFMLKFMKGIVMWLQAVVRDWTWRPRKPLPALCSVLLSFAGAVEMLLLTGSGMLDYLEFASSSPKLSRHMGQQSWTDSYWSQHEGFQWFQWYWAPITSVWAWSSPSVFLSICQYMGKIPQHAPRIPCCQHLVCRKRMLTPFRMLEFFPSCVIHPLLAACSKPQDNCKLFS